MTEAPVEFIACPRCDKSPLETGDDALTCSACKVDFPLLNGIPWMFAEPAASLQDWRNRMHMALQKIGHDSSSVDKELGNKELRQLTQRRLKRFKESLDQHQRKLKKLMEPLDLMSAQGNLESYLALRTRLPSDHGLNTYYANVHRDWCWGDEENQASLKQIRAALHEHADLGRVLVLGCGAGRLAYDIYREFNCDKLVAMDFNPMLMLVFQAMLAGERLKFYEFPIAPAALEDDAVLRTLEAPEALAEGIELVMGDALRAPFVDASFDTVVTPWLIDVIDEDFPVLAARINGLLAENGRWVNFGSLAFTSPKRARCYSPEETKAIIAESGFSDPYVVQSTIPYMCSPASRHGRQEKVFSFVAYKEQAVKKPARHQSLPDWIVTGKEPVPLSQSFRTQAMTTQIYSFIMSLIDGRRSINDMAKVLEKQQLMGREEAVAAIRNFLIKMHSDAQKSDYF